MAPNPRGSPVPFRSFRVGFQAAGSNGEPLYNRDSGSKLPRGHHRFHDHVPKPDCWGVGPGSCREHVHLDQPGHITREDLDRLLDIMEMTRQSGGSEAEPASL